MKYLTKRSCERAIERKIRKLNPVGYRLVPQKEGRLWMIGLTFDLKTKVRSGIWTLDDIRRRVAAAKYGYPGDGRDVEKVKAYFDDALFGAITALHEIDVVLDKGEAVEDPDYTGPSFQDCAAAFITEVTRQESEAGE